MTKLKVEVELTTNDDEDFEDELAGAVEHIAGQIREGYTSGVSQPLWWNLEATKQ